MSALSYTGVGAIVLTVSALVKLSIKFLLRDAPFSDVVDGGHVNGVHGQCGSDRFDRETTIPPGSRHTRLTVTVIVPAHNEETTIARTVRSCLGQTYPIQQIIVVADHCTDRTAERARQAGAVVIVGTGGSKAAAQNLALPYVTSDVVVAIDGDATLNAPAVALMVDTISTGYAGTCPAAR